LVSGSTAAGATPSLVRIGVWSVDGSGDLTLVGSTANDTALFASTATVYTKAFSSSFTMTQGQLYAVGVLIVTAATAPIIAAAVHNVGVEGAVSPRITASLSGQTDLESTISSGSLGGSAGILYARFT
jgi:hypothetical protein